MITIVAEKPSVAREIASVVGAKKKLKGYIEGNGYYITWAFGHLVELEEPEAYDSSLKKWSLNSLPFLPEKFKLRTARRKGVSEQFRTIKTLCKKSDGIICATDAGREGELIFRYIQEKAQLKSIPSKRLWISSLTKEAIRKGLNSLRPLSDFDSLAAAARCRSEADWIIGLNATRAYTVKYSHGNGVFSVGRVQTPVLAMIVHRDKAISQFQSQPFWELRTTYRDVEFIHEKKRFDTMEEAQLLYRKVEQSPFTIVNLEEKEQVSPPPLLFDLTELQRTMNKIAGVSAQDTLSIAQKLYESKLITYPRTDSRYLSDDIFPTCEGLIIKLNNQYPRECSGISSIDKNKRFFNSAKVSDHHAIIPTGMNGERLSGREKLLFDLIVKRFISIFYPNSVSNITNVTGEAAGEIFFAKGKREVISGWKAIYPKEKPRNDEQQLPPFIVQEQGPHCASVRQSETKPPKYFSEATLLSAMEFAGKEVDSDELKDALKGKGIGTPATRASIIEILVKRGYIRKEKKILRAESKGNQLIELLSGQNTLISPELTGAWEHQLHRVSKGEFSPVQFMEAVRKYASVIVSEVTSGSSPLGLGPCPKCGSPVIKGTKGGYGCSAWKTGCPFRFMGEQFGITLSEEHVSQLLARGRLSRPRKIKYSENEELSGYLSINKYGEFSILSREDKDNNDSIGRCPCCGNVVLEEYKSYSCANCEFVVWKKIAGKTISIKLATALLKYGKSIKLDGFRSKKGKRFSATLIIENGKVELLF